MSIVSVNPPASDFLSGLLGARVAGGEPLTLVEAMLANPDQLDALPHVVTTGWRPQPCLPATSYGFTALPVAEAVPGVVRAAAHQEADR